MNPLKNITILALTVWVAGCSTSPVKPDGSYKPGKMSTVTGSITTPTVSSAPANTTQPVRSYVPSNRSPQSVWKPTVIQRVYVDAYEDENGRLVEPTYMYVVRERGGWDVNAVRSKSGYIPDDNAVQPYDMPGVQWGNTAAYENKDTVKPTELFELDEVKVTGLVRKEDEKEAYSLAKENEVVLYDNNVGWVIVPQAKISKVMNIDKPIKTPSSARGNSSGGNFSGNRKDMGVESGSLMNGGNGDNSGSGKSNGSIDMNSIMYEGDL